MKIHVLSDLHTEFADFVPPETDADVVVLAGDIGSTDDLRKAAPDNVPELWIHRHTHAPCDYEMFCPRVLCNPLGYPNESCSEGFAWGLVVEE